MKYLSLQPQILLPSPVTTITGCYFCFGSVSSFFLELFFHWSPVANWAPTNLRSSSFTVLSFFLFILFVRFSRQEIPVVTGKFGLGVQNDAGQRLTEFCQENTLIIVNTLFQQHNSTPISQYWNQIDYVLFSQRWRSTIQSAKNKTWSWPWLWSWTPYCQIKT